MARNKLVNMIGRLSEEQVARLKCDMGTDNIALLNNRDGFPVFQFGKHTIRFRAPYSLDMREIKKTPRGQTLSSTAIPSSARTAWCVS